MLSIAVSSSDDIEISSALDHIISDCEKQLDGAEAKAGIIFTSLMDADFSKMLVKVNLAFPGIHLIGCTTDGEIVPGDGFIQDSVSLLLFAANDISFSSSIALDISKDPDGSIVSAFQKCESELGETPKLGIVLPDGLSTIGIPLQSAIQLGTGNRFPIFGGTAGDDFRFTGTYQFFGDSVYSDALPVLMIGGNLQVESQIRIGPKPIGKRYAITSFEDNIVYTIDDEPASAFYERKLGEWAKEVEIAQFPLAIYAGGSNTYYLRDPLSIDQETGAVSFIGNFENNSWARLTVISKSDILQAADEANEYALKSNGKEGPDLILIFSCTSRKHTLGIKAHREFTRLMEDGRGIPFFGFYCYGEIGPFSKDQPTCFHNDTYITISLSSR